MVTKKQEQICRELYEGLKTVCRQREENRKDILAFSETINGFYHTIKTTWDTAKLPADKLNNQSTPLFYCEAERMACVMENLNIFFTRVNRHLEQTSLVHREVKLIAKKMKEQDKIIGLPEISPMQADEMLKELNNSIGLVSSKLNKRIVLFHSLKKQLTRIQSEFQYKNN